MRTGEQVVAATLRKKRTPSGLRPFDPYRDFGAVTELIATAFGDRLDPGGRAALEEMRRVVRWGPLVWWLYWPRWSGVGSTPGFVWVEERRVVGNVSLRRALVRRGYLVGNVAVNPNWQGRGIANALMRAALEEIRGHGAQWVGLEVREDNQAARALYERMGFREVGRTLHMVRPAGKPWTDDMPSHTCLRRGRSGDAAALIDLVRAIVPESQRALLELSQKDYRPGWEWALDRWLEGRREAWWIAEEHGSVCGAVRARRERRRRPDRLEVLVAPGRDGLFEAPLVQRGLGSLPAARRKLVEIVLPSPTEPLVAALKAAEFRELRVLLQMRLDLAQRISVRR